MLRRRYAAAALAAALLPLAHSSLAGPMRDLERHVTRTQRFHQTYPEDLEDTKYRPDDFQALDASYETLDAASKLREVFDVRVRGTEYRGRYPSLIRGLFPVGKALVPSLLAKSLRTVADEFPEAKLKSIHTFGSVAKVEFVPDPASPYTGLFQGAEGVVRFSYAGPNLPFLIGNVPGLGLKLFVDGRPSENMVAMFGLNTQGPQTSVFQREFANILPPPKGPIMNAIRLAFEATTGKGLGFVQPVDNLAKVDARGNDVAEARWPYKVIFKPVASYPFDAESRRDFRKDLDQVPAGFKIYDVFAEDQEGSTERTRIGELVTRSEFVSSSYGDKKLFFKHNARFLKDKFR